MPASANVPRTDLHQPQCNRQEAPDEIPVITNQELADIGTAFPRIPGWLRAYQFSFLLLVIPVLAIQDLDVNVETLKYWQVWTLLLISTMPIYITWMAWRGNKA